jgi:hypothetical protein
MPGQVLLSTVALVIASAWCLSILIFQGITGVTPLSSNSIEAADIVALLKQAGLAGAGGRFFPLAASAHTIAEARHTVE